MSDKNIYHILGVNYEADQSTIEIAYRQLALLYHPDRNHAKEAASLMADINHAYEILKNGERRKKYDREHLFRQTVRTPSAPPPIKPIINHRTWEPRIEDVQPKDIQAFIIELHYHPYAIELDALISVLPAKTIRWVQEKPNWIAGVIEHQGKFYPASDLRDLLDLSLPETGKNESYVLCRIQGMEIALKIDKAVKTTLIPAKAIKAVPSFEEDQTLSFINGLFLEGDQVILFLNLDGLFTPSQWEELNEFTSTLKLT